MTYNNAASRLRDLLIKAKEIDRNISNKQAWDLLLQTNNNRALLLSRMGKFISLPEIISTTISNNVDTNTEVFKHIEDQVYKAFTSQVFNDIWAHFTNHIDDHTLNYLGLASSLLETQTKTKKLESEELEEIRDSFVKLLDTVRNSEISPKLKSYIATQLHNLISSVDDYFITGAEPILNQVETTVGHAFVDPEYKSFLRDDELGRSVLECLSAAANLVTVAIGVPQITQLTLLLT